MNFRHPIARKHAKLFSQPARNGRHFLVQQKVDPQLGSPRSGEGLQGLHAGHRMVVVHAHLQA